MRRGYMGRRGWQAPPDYSGEGGGALTQRSRPPANGGRWKSTGQMQLGATRLGSKGTGGPGAFQERHTAWHTPSTEGPRCLSGNGMRMCGGGMCACQEPRFLMRG